MGEEEEKSGQTKSNYVYNVPKTFNADLQKEKKEIRKWNEI